MGRKAESWGRRSPKGGARGPHALGGRGEKLAAQDVRRWLGRLGILVTFSVATQLAIRWAVLPGFWTGSWLRSGDETALELAKSKFGPVLLVHHWLSDPEGTWGTKEEVLQHWGFFETGARLRLIVWVLSGLACILLIIAIKLRTRQPSPPR